MLDISKLNESDNGKIVRVKKHVDCPGGMRGELVGTTKTTILVRPFQSTATYGYYAAYVKWDNDD